MANQEVKPVAPERRPRRRLRTPNPVVRARILAASMDLIRTRGFSTLRIDELAAQAEISVGTFYLYFDGKDELFTSLVVEHTRLLRERLEQAMAGAPNEEERAERRLDAYLDFVEENEHAFLHFLRAGSMQTTVGDLSTWALGQHAEDVRPLVDESIRSGAIRAVDAELLVQAVLASTQHLAGYWLQHKDRYTRAQIKEFIRELSLAVLVGLRPR